MLGKITVVQKDKKAVFVELEHPADFRTNEVVNISKAKKRRTLKQNALYWCYLTWVLHPKGGDLRSQGWFSVDGLHENVKEWIKESHAHDFKMDKRFTTTELSTEEFGQFFDLVNQELFVEFLGINTSPFWVEYEKYSRWTEYGREDFREYMDEIPFMRSEYT